MNKKIKDDAANHLQGIIMLLHDLGVEPTAYESDFDPDDGFEEYTFNAGDLRQAYLKKHNVSDCSTEDVNAWLGEMMEEEVEK